jgi:hypothetical protein
MSVSPRCATEWAVDELLTGGGVNEHLAGTGTSPPQSQW